MIRQAAFVLCSVIAVGQALPEDPFEVANQAYFQARQKGQYAAATAQRERMNQLLQAQAPDQPQFAGQAQRLAQLYDNDGMSATARTVLEGALARAEGANAKGQARASLLLPLASFWERDRNLLKSQASLEKAAAILEHTPAVEEPAQKGNGAMGFVVNGRASAVFADRPGVISGAGPLLRWYGGAGFQSTTGLVSVYMQLADLYQRLGRRDQAGAVLAKIKALPAQPDNSNLAQYYQQHGDPEEAAAIYRKQMDEAASDPRQMPFPAESLANIYQQMKRPDDAAAVLREAVTALDASGNSELAAQSGLRQQLAMQLFQSGHAEAADQAFPTPVDNGPAAARLALNYASYLGASKRASQAEAFLADFLTGHPDLNTGEQANILFTLAGLARSAGDAKRAEEYQLEGEQKRTIKDPPPDVVLIGPVLQKAQSEASGRNTAGAIALVGQAITQSANAQDRETLARVGLSVANIVANKSPAQADELYRNVTEVTQSWSPDTMQPWLTAVEGYPRFLMSAQRNAEAAPAIERYRSALKASRGADTGWMEEPLRLTVELERGRNSPQAAILPAQNLVALEETLDGPTSEPLYRAAETLAQLYGSTGDSARALPLYQQTVAIADAVFRADDPRRGQSRTNAARLLIAEHRPDEAEVLVLEAIDLRKTTPAGGRDALTQMLEQIRAMKKTQ